MNNLYDYTVQDFKAWKKEDKIWAFKSAQDVSEGYKFLIEFFNDSRFLLDDCGLKLGKDSPSYSDLREHIYKLWDELGFTVEGDNIKIY